MKIYTRTGDEGHTRLPGGAAVSKADGRIEALGALDELNAALGLAAAAGPSLRDVLQRVQHELLAVGANVAAWAGQAGGNVPVLGPEAVERLEREIDAAEEQLAPLRQFILPGGSEAAARLHVARGVCRRAERAVVRLGGTDEGRVPWLAYLNRLSDWLFVMARLANKQAGVPDVLWSK
jgi:cob(I)alamin adenosyltransferase